MKKRIMGLILVFVLTVSAVGTTLVMSRVSEQSKPVIADLLPWEPDGATKL